MWENIVTKVVEPPVLMSKTLTFVLAASVIVLTMLFVTLMNMAPLTRPEIFFLRYQSRTVDYVLEQPNPKGKDFKPEYLEGCVRAYVIARNTLEKQKRITIDKWNTIVKSWSSPQVYSDFTKTDLYKNVMLSHRLPGIYCEIDFDKVTSSNYDQVYHVVFNRICYNQNNGRQIEQKSYKIDIEIQSYLKNIVSDNLEELRDNPLGIQITKYNVIDKNNREGIDPLSDLDLEVDFYKEGIRR